MARRAFLLGLGTATAAFAGITWVRLPDPARRPAVPAARLAEARFLGLPNERFFPELPAGVEALRGEFMAATARLRDRLGLPEGAPPQERTMLAISGGGSDGAFSAGLLCGWTEHGTRPVFHLVTGVSAGALIAPFAFIGPARDAQLRALYTTLRQEDVLRRRGWIEAAFGDAIADNAPLAATIARHLDAGMLADIARGHAEGRLLLISTVNLDAQVAVIWNLGAIAASGHPRALDLARRILLASAAIPGIFPPAMFDVSLDGRLYQEMHVDGGTFAQSFLYPDSFGQQRRDRLRAGLPVPAVAAYVIRNAQHDLRAPEVARRLLGVAQTAVTALIRANGHGDVARIHANAVRDGIAFRLAHIGPDFGLRTDTSFDPAYMRALFDHAFDRARAGYPWADRPPF
ncbi:patatin family protein [Roseomonas eburnea]|uniref:Patatin family protein n=1 Tax=Neoroseomonas eburnea TaxID=1346889 RepID=A0A9X9XG30_9PROT|nr:patatin-like phospholipase family protein [Neoroseomonas eburnea]MBR0682666.1 patatin family protein [Neoroseomonas eburnea]